MSSNGPSLGPDPNSDSRKLSCRSETAVLHATGCNSREVVVRGRRVDSRNIERLQWHTAGAVTVGRELRVPRAVNRAES